VMSQHGPLFVRSGAIYAQEVIYCWSICSSLPTRGESAFEDCGAFRLTRDGRASFLASHGECGFFF
jgi:hypothetical protein